MTLPPVSVRTSHHAVKKGQNNIYRSLPPTKILGQKAENNPLKYFSESPIKIEV